jgi:acetyl esterase/lipase
MSDLTRRELLGSMLIGAAAGLTPAAAGAVDAVEPLTSPLYPDGIPGGVDGPDEEAMRDPREAWPFRINVSRPTLTVYRPTVPAAKRAAVIVCPGGGYRGVSIEKEGHGVARAFNEFGVAAIVLKYRTPTARSMKDPTTGPLQDVQQALHALRRRANEWGIEPTRVGVVGFSAGGHLAASASTQFDRPVLAEHAESNLRPDFSILIYPVISMSDELAHTGSREQLLGSSPSAALIERYSAERAVTNKTPPALLIHAADDATVVVGNSIRYFEALNARRIPAQLFVYPRGGHGFGLNNPTTSDRWIDRARQWMMSEGWIVGESQAEEQAQD